MILYFGNILSGHGKSVSVIEYFSKDLGEDFEIKAFSNKKSQVLRLLEMIQMLFKYRSQAKVVLMDVYSTKAFYFAYIIAVLCQLLGKKYICFLHGGNLPERLKKNPGLSKTLFNKSLANVSPSKYLHKAFVDAGFQAKYIPNYLRLDAYPFLNRTPHSGKILWVRSFHHIYNPVMAIDMLFELRKKLPNATLCMVGTDKDGTLELVKNRISELGLTDVVEITGFLPKEEWVRRSTQYEVFINTTTIDNHPVSLIEAMALGLPIVSTGVGGVPFLIDDQKTGLLVPNGDFQAMADAIEKLISSPEYFSQIASNARFAADEFDWENVKKQWIDLINPCYA